MRAVVAARARATSASRTSSWRAPKAGEVLVRIAACGVCHSDLHLADGRLGDGRWPMVLGHEGAGTVEAVGEGVVHVAPGDRVVLCMIPSCGTCSACRAGRPTLCGPAGEAGVRGTLMDGTSRLSLPDGTPLQHGLTVACFAERTVVAAAGVVPLTVDVPLWQAALLGCGAVTGIGAVRNVARPRIGERAAVVGCGGVGQQVIAGLVLAGASAIVAVDRDPAVLDLALARGATHAVDARVADPAAVVRELTDGGVEHAFEVVGRPETMRLAWDCLRAGGTAVDRRARGRRRRGRHPGHRVPLRQGHQGLLLRQRQPVRRARLARPARGRRAARAGRRRDAPDRSRRHPRGPGAPAHAARADARSRSSTRRRPASRT